MSATCFACSNPATTREHVPPLCLFPEAKDAHGFDLRQDLITVPACDLHNLSKSKDDEYLLWVLTSYSAVNIIGKRLSSTKVRRAHLRRPALGRSLLVTAEPITAINGSTGEVSESRTIQLDAPRVVRALELVALGLYFHEFGTRWNGGMRLHADFFDVKDHPDRPAYNATRIQLFELARAAFANVPPRGANPHVFMYAVLHDDSSAMMRLQFYGGCTATALFGSDPRIATSPYR